MNRQILTIWIAGIMIGTGSGIIIARVLPKTVLPKTESAISSNLNLEQSQKEFSFQQPSVSHNYLLDPHQYPMPSFFDRHLAKKEVVPAPQTEPSSIAEPRLFPQGKALPVEKKLEVAPKQRPTSSPFRKQLEEIAPEFPEEALLDLDAIHTIIESENNPSVPKKSSTKQSKEAPKQTSKNSEE